MSSSDARDMELYYQCDVEAFERLQARVWPRLLRFVRPAADDEAEDLALEVLYRVARTKFRRRNFDPAVGDFGAWLYGIAYHEVAGWARAAARRPVPLDPVAADRLADEVDPPAPPAGEDGLAACLDALPATQREVLLLADAEGLDLPTIARLLAVSYGAAATRLSRARQRLTSLLQEAGLRVVERGAPLPPGTVVEHVFRQTMIVRVRADARVNSAVDPP